MMIAATVAGLPLSSQASGYRFGSQSVSAQSVADANGAEANDASTIFSNPAGMTRLEGTQVTGGVTLIAPSSSFRDTGSTNFVGTSTGSGTVSDYAPNVVAAPSLYVSKKINSQWSVGAGLFVPYGAKLDYGNSWSGRYALTNIKLEALTLNPSAAFKLDEHHSFGFGLSAEYMKAKLGQGVDVPGSVAYLSKYAPSVASAFISSVASSQGLAAAQAAAVALQGAKDGHASMTGDDWGLGFNLGYLYQLDEATRFGLAYRSSVAHKLRGSAVWDFSGSSSNATVNAFLAQASGKVNSAALVRLHTPETISANVFRQINTDWAAMADITWSRTSRLSNLDIEFPGTSEGAEVIRQNWRNTYRFSLGGSYRYSDNLSLRAGVAYDQSPVRSAELTHPALPDSDRIQYSIGANWRLDARSSLNLAYSYLHFKDANINYTNSCTPVTSTCTGNGETTRGVYQTHLQMVGLAYTYVF